MPPESGELADAAGPCRRARRPARWTSCASCPAASTRRSWPRAGSARRCDALARRSPIPVELDLRVEGRLPEQVEISAYYVVAEALTNAAKHAAASAVTGHRRSETGRRRLRVQVRDDGVGGADFTGGTGLLGLKDRVEALGGRIFLDSPRGAGTTLRVRLPLTT